MKLVTKIEKRANGYGCAINHSLNGINNGSDKNNNSRVKEKKKESIISRTQSSFSKLNSNQFEALLTFLNIADIYRLHMAIKIIPDSKCNRLLIQNFMLNLSRKITNQQQLQYASIFSHIYNNHQERLSEFIKRVKSEVKSQYIILEDVARTYDEGKSSKALKQYLTNILGFINKQFPQVGYIQGFNYIIKAIYLNGFSEWQGFMFVSYLLKQMQLQKIYVDQMNRVFEYSYVLEVYMFNYVPKLYYFMKKIDIQILYFAADWFITLFSQQLHLSTLNRLWNVFLFKGWKIIIRFAIAVLFCFQDEIMKRSKQQLSTYLKHFLQSELTSEKEDQIFKLVTSIKITNRMIHLLQKNMILVERDSQIFITYTRKNVSNGYQQSFVQNKNQQQTSCYCKKKSSSAFIEKQQKKLSISMTGYKNNNTKQTFFLICEAPISESFAILPQ